MYAFNRLPAPDIHPSSPLQDWNTVRMLITMGIPVEYDVDFKDDVDDTNLCWDPYTGSSSDAFADDLYYFFRRAPG